MFTLTVFILLGIQAVLSNYEYVNVGCFKDYRGDRALKEYIGSFPSQDAITKCAEISAAKGFLVFGVEYGGECYSGPQSESTYNKYGPMTNCRNGVGGDWSFDAYRFKVCRNLHFDSFPVSSKALTNHMVVEHKVENEELCRIQCFMNIDCVSYNIGPSSIDGMMTCELNDADRYQHSKDYTNKTGFSYHGTKNICNTNPCIDGAVCKAGLGRDPFRCVCPLNHPGRHCKKSTP